MNIEDVRDYCLSLPMATEDVPFPSYPEIVAWRIGGKVFAMLDLDDPEWFVLKCDPDRAVALRDSHAEVRPAWHMNKRHWNQISLFGELPDALIRDLIGHSYDLVKAKLPKRLHIVKTPTPRKGLF